MNRIIFSFLISLTVHASIVYGLIYFTQASSPKKPKAVAIKLKMFKAKPAPKFTPALPMITEARLVVPPVVPILKPKQKIQPIVKLEKKKKINIKKRKKLKPKLKRVPKSKKNSKKKVRRIEKHIPKAIIKDVPIVQAPVELKPKNKHKVINNNSVKSIKAKDNIIIANDNKIKEAENSYRNKLNRLISKNKKYPRKAKRMGQQGTVKVSFVVLSNGKIKDITVKNSSRSKSLDRAAKKLIKKISGSLPFSILIKRSQWQFDIDIKYSLS
jgi:protein TonB